MSYLFDPGAALGILSGLAMIVLGITLLRLGARRRDGIAFAAFAIHWGVFVCLLNGSLMAADPATAEPWVYAFVAVSIPLYVPLLVFVSTFPTPWNPLGRNPVAMGLLALPGVLGMLLLAAEPGLFVEDVVTNPQGLPSTLFGPLGTIVGVVDTQLAFVVALGVVLYQVPRARDATERSQLALLAAAFLAYVSYRAAFGASVGLSLYRVEGWPWQLGLRLVVAGLGLTAVVVGLVTLTRPRAGEGSAPWRDLVAACGIVPLVVGLGEVAATEAGIVGFRSAGVWRLVMVALFAYGIARTRLFDLDLRVRSAASTATYVVGAIAAVLLVWTVMGEAFSGTPVLGVTASLGAVAVVVPLLRISWRTVGSRRASPDGTTYLYERKLDVYRTALREARDRGLGGDEERSFLGELRADLGISEDEHRALLHALDHPLGDTGMDRFEIEEELGRGGFGRALLARDRVLGRSVVLKEPLPAGLDDADVRERALREARLAAGINHPNVVTVYEVLADRDPPLLVLEYVEGGSLDERIEAEAPMEPAEAVGIAVDVLDGAGALHELGIVHRDLKPENLLLDADGRVRITDLGIATPPEDADVNVTLIGDGSRAGSLAYMSPEQAAGGDADQRSDLYSVAVVLYRMLTGEHYLDLAGPPHAIVLRRIQEDEPRLPHPSIPPSIEPILERALAKDPEDRYPDAGAFAEALEDALSKEATGDGPA